MEGTKSTPWLDGKYKNEHSGRVNLVEGNILRSMSLHIPSEDPPKDDATITFGDFGETDPEMAEQTGEKNYNVRIFAKEDNLEINAVLSGDGKKFFFRSFMNSEIVALEWINEEEFEALQVNFGSNLA